MSHTATVENSLNFLLWVDSVVSVSPAPLGSNTLGVEAVYGGVTKKTYFGDSNFVAATLMRE